MMKTLGNLLLGLLICAAMLFGAAMICGCVYGCWLRTAENKARQMMRDGRLTFKQFAWSSGTGQGLVSNHALCLTLPDGQDIVIAEKNNGALAAGMAEMKY